MKTFVDSNVFVYAKDVSEIERKPIAQSWLNYLWATNSGRVSAQVLSEYYNTLTRKLNPGIEVGIARTEVRALWAWQPLPVDESLMQAAWVVEHRYGLSWWDSLIVAAAQHLGCDRLLTEDLQPGQRYGDVVVVSPFREDPPSLPE